jgi:hypothetical protein
MIQAFLDSLEPDGEQLLSEISKHITDDMLEEIALADYGQGQEQHLAALRRLRDTGTFVEPMFWYPCEVLELIRNSEPEDPLLKPGSLGIRGHWMRAFASSALLRALGPPWEYKGDAARPSYTLIKLIYSLRALPFDLTSAAVCMLAWLMLHSDLEGLDIQIIYYGVGLLWLAMHRNPPPPDRDLGDLSEWIVRRESELAKQLPGGFDRWLLGISGNNPPPSPWETLGLELRSLYLGSHQKQLQEWVKLIGCDLAGDTAS